jgi:hypothetical protein
MTVSNSGSKDEVNKFGALRICVVEANADGPEESCMAGCERSSQKRTKDLPES